MPYKNIEDRRKCKRESAKRRYKNSPKVREKVKEYNKEYFSRPSVKKKHKIYMRNYKRKVLNIPKEKFRVKD